eukprot:COSAG01_NODE_38726_length_486_cov_0.550388_2_plen_37_part_01
MLRRVDSTRPRRDVELTAAVLTSLLQKTVHLSLKIFD